MPKHSQPLASADVELERVFHALSDPSRRSMFERLCGGPASVGELAAPLPMSLPAVMQHIAVLQDSGLISSRKQGRVRICEVEPRALERAESWMAERRRFWEAALDRLGAFLEEQADIPEERSAQ